MRWFRRLISARLSLKVSRWRQPRARAAGERATGKKSPLVVKSEARRVYKLHKIWQERYKKWRNVFLSFASLCGWLCGGMMEIIRVRLERRENRQNI